MRPCGMPGNERLLPRRQFGIDLGYGLRGLYLKPGNLLFGIDWRIARSVFGSIALRRLPQFLDPAFQIGNRLFEIEENVHRIHAKTKRRARVASRAMSVKSSAYGFSPGPRQRVSHLDGLLEAVTCHMGIDLCRSNVGMTKQC